MVSPKDGSDKAKPFSDSGEQTGHQGRYCACASDRPFLSSCNNEPTRLRIGIGRQIRNHPPRPIWHPSHPWGIRRKKGAGKASARPIAVRVSWIVVPNRLKQPERILDSPSPTASDHMWARGRRIHIGRIWPSITAIIVPCCRKHHRPALSKQPHCRLKLSNRMPVLIQPNSLIGPPRPTEHVIALRKLARSHNVSVPDQGNVRRLPARGKAVACRGQFDIQHHLNISIGARKRTCLYRLAIWSDVTYSRNRKPIEPAELNQIIFGKSPAKLANGNPAAPRTILRPFIGLQ